MSLFDRAGLEPALTYVVFCIKDDIGKVGSGNLSSGMGRLEGRSWLVGVPIKAQGQNFALL